MPDSTTWVEQQNLNQITTQLNQLQTQLNSLSYDVGRILSALNRGTTPTALTIDVANQEIIAKDGTLIMSGIANVTSNYDLRIPLIWQDATGVAVPPASGNTQASSSNLLVVPEIDIADDDLSIVVHVAALGSSFVTVSNGGITNIIQVIVENPIATSLYIDAAHAVALPKTAKYLYIDAAAARMVPKHTALLCQGCAT